MTAQAEAFATIHQANAIASGLGKGVIVVCRWLSPAIDCGEVSSMVGFIL